MDRQPESPRFVLILGSLFLIAYAAFQVGSAWMDAVSAENVSAIGTPTLTPTPSNINQTPTVSPTRLPLRWITPTNTPGAPADEEPITATPENASPTVAATPTSDEGAAPTVTTAPPTPTLPSELPTSTPSNATPTPTSDAYPGPEPTESPTPTPTDDPYPGPDVTSTPVPTLTATSTGKPEEPGVTLTPSSTPRPADPGIAPTQSATSVIPAPASFPTTTLAYTETLVLSDGAINQVVWSQGGLTLTLATSDGLYFLDADSLELGHSVDGSCL